MFERFGRKVFLCCLGLFWLLPVGAWSATGQEPPVVVNTNLSRNAEDGVIAASAGDFEISWYSIDGGGTVAGAEGGLALEGTAGQPDAGTSSAAGAILRGGFWSVVFESEIFSDGFESGDTTAWNSQQPQNGGF